MRWRSDASCHEFFSRALLCFGKKLSSQAYDTAAGAEMQPCRQGGAMFGSGARP
jgi:hypothetical protein